MPKYSGLLNTAGQAGIDVTNIFQGVARQYNPDLPKAADWWKGYEGFKNEVRKGIFGATLTSKRTGSIRSLQHHSWHGPGTSSEISGGAKTHRHRRVAAPSERPDQRRLQSRNDRRCSRPGSEERSGCNRRGQDARGAEAARLPRRSQATQRSTSCATRRSMRSRTQGSSLKSTQILRDRGVR